MKNNKSFMLKILMLIALIIFIIGLIWVGFAAVKMIDKWIGRKAKAETLQKAVGGIGNLLPGSPFGK